MMMCQNCGQVMPDGARFCSNCGKPLLVSYMPAQDYPQNSYTQRKPAQTQLLSGKAIASLMLGILSVLAIVFIFPTKGKLGLVVIPISIVGLLLGFSAEKDAKRQGKRSTAAIFGLILSLVVIGTTLAGLIKVLFIYMIVILFR